MVTDFINIKMVKIRNIALLLITAVLAACSTTSLTESWKEADVNRSYSHPLIIGISDSQQTRRIYENYFVNELKKKNITATPSYQLLNSKQPINRETVLKAVENTSIDSVLVTYLVTADSVVRHSDSPLNPTSYSGNPDDNMISATLISERGRTSSSEEIGLKNDFYDVQAEKMVWSAQTNTVAPESIDQTITEVTKLLIKELFNDNILK
jgi:hypothetical protein